MTVRRTARDGLAARGRLVGGLVASAGRAVLAALAPIGRRAPEIVVVVALVLSGLGVLVLVGAARNDATIDAHRGTAVAEVLDGSTYRRTFVRFTAANGAVLTPQQGVFYPSGLEPGNLVRVEYDTTKPQLVRVEGRTWRQGLLPVALGVVGVWALLGPAAWALARRRRRRATPTVAGPAGAAGDREPVGASR